MTEGPPPCLALGRPRCLSPASPQGFPVVPSDLVGGTWALWQASLACRLSWLPGIFLSSAASRERARCDSLASQRHFVDVAFRPVATAMCLTVSYSAEPRRLAAVPWARGSLGKPRAPSTTAARPHSLRPPLL